MGHPPETKTENIPSQVKALANVKIVQVKFNVLLENSVLYLGLCYLDLGTDVGY